MASSTTLLLFLTILTTILTVSVTARPCKTIFFITSTSTSSSFENPNNPTRFTFLITQVHTRPFSTNSNDVVSSNSKLTPSFADRTMDIMSVVGALLFGAGCGALTAAVIYLIWSLCSNRRFDYASDDGEDDVSVEKNGYVAVPVTDVKEVPPTADEVDAMKQ